MKETETNHSARRSVSKTLKTRLRRKSFRIASRLETFLGVPQQAERLAGPLEMLIATILSQNTNDKNSHRAYKELRARFPTWKRLAGASVQSIADAIRTGGMANQKAARIKNTLHAVKQRFGTYSLAKLRSMSNEQVIGELIVLDGVGFKTASCVLLFSLGRDVFPVDTHIHRICTRLELSGGSRHPDDTYHIMKDLAPKGRGYSFHTNLIRFGRLVCRSTHPYCGDCPLFSECRHPNKERSHRMNGKRRQDFHFMLLDNIRA